jgi:uncharacterized membrane protein YedE/YeeE
MNSFILFPLLGGALIGLSASLLLWANGRVAGISGVVGALVAPTRGDVSWRLVFLGGLLTGGMVLAWLSPGVFAGQAPPSPGGAMLLVAAGLLVGFGSRLGNGCTSGHGVCGLSRGSARALAATLTFMATGAFTVFLARHIF